MQSMHQCVGRINAEAVHNYYLNNLIYNLDKIDEDLSKVNWVFRDGIWFKDRAKQRESLCDLVLVTYDKMAIPIELKSSRKKRQKAVHQIYQGRDFINNVLELPCEYGKFVIYENDGFKYETIDLKVR